MTKTWSDWNATRTEAPLGGRVFYYVPAGEAALRCAAAMEAEEEAKWAAAAARSATQEPERDEDDATVVRRRAPRAARRSTVHAPEAAYARPGSPFVFAARTRRAK